MQCAKPPPGGHSGGPGRLHAHMQPEAPPGLRGEGGGDQGRRRGHDCVRQRERRLRHGCLGQERGRRRQDPHARRRQRRLHQGMRRASHADSAAALPAQEELQGACDACSTAHAVHPATGRRLACHTGTEAGCQACVQHAAQAVGAELDLGDKGLGTRSRRYAMVAEDGVVQPPPCSACRAGYTLHAYTTGRMQAVCAAQSA